ncbi:MAG: protease pro-enzyme activation domain-containing protein [Capsulimonas sp.]|uniref:protease pro-enzyme activation domain-containing protein n=1 Tax=Capsulimonas sp. TaxID=2494211 RepID=UPI0032659415
MLQFYRTLHHCASLLLAGVAFMGLSAQAQPAANIAVTGSPSARHGALMERAAPAASDTLHLVFALSSRRQGALSSFVQSQYDPSSPNFHRWLTPDEFGARFGAEDSDVDTITQYAKSQGFAVTQVWPNKMFVSVDARTADAERAFGVKLHSYLRPQVEIAAGLPATFHAPDRAPALPYEIAGRVQGLFGLSNEAAARPALVRGQDFAAPATPLAAAPHIATLTTPATPSTLAAYYGFDRLHLHGINGDGQSIAIFSPTHYSAADFASFRSTYSLTGTTVTEVLVNGGPTDSDGADEAALDLDVIVGQAPHSHIYLYESPNDSNLAIWNKIASDNIPVVSVSWGNSEQDITSAYANSVNTILQQMSAQGQSVFVATGDFGSFDGNNITPSVDFPASSPYVTGVGGTSIPNGVTETGWSGSGGGLSVFFSRPFWQAGPGVINTSSTGFRQLPDIATLADTENPGYRIYSGGRLRIFGGTSAGAPLLAAANTLINQGLNGRTGQLTPKLYQFGGNTSNAPQAFTDILSGGNGTFSCTARWDYVTGWGSPKVAGLYSLIVPTPLGPDPPVISQLTPSSAPAGSLGVTITVTGTNFTASSIVRWNGTALPTQVVSSTSLTATVPASFLTAVGTAAITVSDPSSTTPAGPLTFTITTPHSFAPGLQMISAPYDYTGTPFTTLFGNITVKIATWEPAAENYVLNPTPPADTFHLGRAYWVRLGTTANLPALGTAAPANAPYTVPIAAGWNMIGDPFNASAAISSLQVTAGGTTKSFAAAVTAGTVSGTLYRYDAALHYYIGQTSGALAPFAGYWIYAAQPCSLVFPAP